MTGRRQGVFCALLAGCVLVWALCFPVPVRAGSLVGAVEGLRVDQIDSVDQMRAALQLLQTCLREAAENGDLTFELQKLLLSRAGDCVGVIVRLSSLSGNGAPRGEVLRNLFAVNREVIHSMLEGNRKTVRDYQEHTLDTMLDTAAFFASPAWQQPQYLISLAGYWLSWNSYYTTLTGPPDGPARAQLLQEAVDGFSRSSIDFSEAAIIVRSLFGRALCYKALQQYDRAVQDLQRVTARITAADPLYLRSRYEAVLITLLAGNPAAALAQLDTLQDDLQTVTVPEEMCTSLAHLRVRISAELLARDPDPAGPAAVRHGRAIVGQLVRLTQGDSRFAPELYEFVQRHPGLCVQLPPAELGPIGNLALADQAFNQEAFARAVACYQQVQRSRLPFVMTRLDDVCFRLGYSYCRLERWEDALQSFSALFQKYPGSEFIDRAACLQYVAAGTLYKNSPTQPARQRYIEAIELYLDRCPDPVDRNEAHYQLGKYRQDRGQTAKAVASFSHVEAGSPRYTEALFTVLQYRIEQIEKKVHAGSGSEGASSKTRAACRETATQLEAYAAAVLQGPGSDESRELEAHLDLMRARLGACGTADDCRVALQLLNSARQGRAAAFQTPQMRLVAVRVRLGCCERLGLIEEARVEVERVLAEASIDLRHWDMLQQFADRLYGIVQERTSAGDAPGAASRAGLARMIYEKLSAAAAGDHRFSSWQAPMRLRMADLYFLEGNTGAARPLYEGILREDPQSADALYKLGLIHEQEHHWQEALQTWRTFSRGLQPGSHYWYESRYHTARALGERGDTERACEIMSMTRILHPELRDAAFKKRFLALEREICETTAAAGHGD